MTKIEEIDMFLFVENGKKCNFFFKGEKKGVCLRLHDRSENFYDAPY
jgi:hypothetical protein